MAKKKNREPVEPIEPSTERETDPSFEAKKSAKTVGTASKSPFQRVFSDEDEIAILNGIIEFEAANNVSPSLDMDAFLAFIKNSLHVSVSKKQMQDKISKMRKRFAKNKGKDMSSAKPQDKAILELSEKLWGVKKADFVDVGNASVSVVAKNVSKKADVGNANVSSVAKNVSKKADLVEVGNANLSKKADLVEVGNANVSKKADVGNGNVSGVAKNVSKKAANDGKKEADVDVGNATGSMVPRRNVVKKKKVVVDVGNATGSGITRRNVSRKTDDGGKNVAAVEVGNDGSEVMRRTVTKKKDDGGKKTATRNASKKAGYGAKKEDVVLNGVVGGCRYVGLSNEEKILRMGAELFGGADKKITGWEDWKKLQRKEMWLSVKQLDVKRAKVKLVLDTMK